MGILLDTSVLIDLERRGGSIPEEEELALAAITASELLHGVHRADARSRPRRQAFVEGVLSSIPTIAFSLPIARTHAGLWVELEASRLPGPHDLQVAATALALGWQLATLNRRHFIGIPGLELFEL